MHLLLINTTGIPIVGAIWFLTALLFTDVIYIFLAKYNIKWIILFLVVAGSYADQVLPNSLPWALSAAFVGLGLYWIGNETAKNQDKLKAVLNMPLLLCIILGIQALLEANGLVAGKDHQFKGRYDAEKNAVIISLEKDEQSALSPQKCTT